MHPKIERAAFLLTCGSVAAILFSIAVSQILLALAFAALLLSGQPIRFPPLKLPLLLFIAGTFASLALSGAARDGTPQIRKFFVLLTLLLVYSTFRTIANVRTMILVWAGLATLSAVRSLFQFLHKYQESRELHRNFYEYYVAERITGFMSHWMTFGGQEMIALLLLAAYLFFSEDKRLKSAGWMGVAVLGASLILGFTRSIFLLGVPAGLLYLLWFWRKWLVAAAPALFALGVLAAPAPVRQRIASIVQPQGQTDSNLHRAITRRTGLEMIRAHPWFGVGPEQVKARFNQYVPADIPRPLPEGWYGHLHNIYLQYAAERGIPTALMLFWMIGKILYDFAAALRRRKFGADGRFILHGAIAVILAILAEGLFEYNLGDSEVLTMFLAVVGFGYIARGADPAVERAELIHSN